MLTGHVDHVERDFVAGWAADDQSAAIKLSVVVYVNGQRYAQLRCDRDTSDRTDASPGGACADVGPGCNPQRDQSLDLRGGALRHGLRAGRAFPVSGGKSL